MQKVRHVLVQDECRVEAEMEIERWDRNDDGDGGELRFLLSRQPETDVASVAPIVRVDEKHDELCDRLERILDRKEDADDLHSDRVNSSCRIP
jgi:hypothetical protein